MNTWTILFVKFPCFFFKEKCTPRKYCFVADKASVNVPHFVTLHQEKHNFPKTTCWYCMLCFFSILDSCWKLWSFHWPLFPYDRLHPQARTTINNRWPRWWLHIRQKWLALVKSPCLMSICNSLSIAARFSSKEATHKGGKKNNEGPYSSCLLSYVPFFRDDHDPLLAPALQEARHRSARLAARSFFLYFPLVPKNDHEQ